MNHDEARDLIRQQFVDGQLDTDVSRALRAHLGTCASCRALYDRWADAEGSLGESRAAAAAAERMWPLVEPELAATAPSRRRFAPVLAVVAAAAVVAIVLYPPAPSGPITDFTLRLRNTQSMNRSPSSDDPEVLYPSSELVLGVQPEEATSEELEVAAFWVGDEVRSLLGAWTRSPNGFVEWTRGEDGFIPSPGDYKLVVVIGRDVTTNQESIRRTVEALQWSKSAGPHAFDAANRDDRTQWFVVAVEVQPEPTFEP